MHVSYELLMRLKTHSLQGIDTPGVPTELVDDVQVIDPLGGAVDAF